MSNEPRMSSKEIADIVKWPHKRIRMEVMNAEGSQYYEDRKHFPNPVPRETIVDEDGELRDAFLLNAQQVQVVMRRLKGIPGLRTTKKAVLACMDARVNEARVDGFMEKLAELGQVAKPARPKKVKLRAQPSHEELSLTSREVAKLVKVRHDNLKRSIERLAGHGRIRLPQKREVLHQGKNDARMEECYIFEGDAGEQDLHVVLAHLSPELASRMMSRRRKGGKSDSLAAEVRALALELLGG